MTPIEIPQRSPPALTTIWRLIGAAVIVILALPPTTEAQTAAPTLAPSGIDNVTGNYVFSYFINNGEDGLHLATSTDGYHWQTVAGGNSVLRPIVGESKLMRDPCILFGPDQIFRMVWTDSWTGTSIGYASSPDLVHWSAETAVPVMAAEPTTLNTWAPEVHYDAKGHRYIIFWASTIPGRFPQTQGTGDGQYNHRIYSTTTTDFKSFSPTKLYFDPGFDCIDATLLAADNKFYMIFKDETLNPVRKNLRIATSGDINGPFTNVTEAFTRQWVEGPTAIRVGDDTIVYYDCYRDGKYGAVRSRDMKTWEDISDRISFPPAAHHGTVIAVPPQILAGFSKAAPPQ